MKTTHHIGPYTLLPPSTQYEKMGKVWEFGGDHGRWGMVTYTRSPVVPFQNSAGHELVLDLGSDTE